MGEIHTVPTQPKTENQTEWEQYLETVGLGADLPPIYPGKQEPLGDGLGRKSPREERKEDTGRYHSLMCPINLGTDLTGDLNQPNDRPVEEEVFGEMKKKEQPLTIFIGSSTRKKLR